MLRDALVERGIEYSLPAQYRDFRAGDVRHSLANVDKAKPNTRATSPLIQWGRGLLRRCLGMSRRLHNGELKAACVPLNRVYWYT